MLNRCVLSNNIVAYNSGGGAQYSVLTNCTLIGNSAYYAAGVHYCTIYDSLIRSNQGTTGAGAIGGTLVRCVLEYNSASNWGGGAYSATLKNCLVRSNYAASLGGGAIACSLNNCTLVGNHSNGSGGGAAQCAPVNNCILDGNTALVDGANYLGGGIPESVYVHCCTQPLPATGTGNITNYPLFVDPTGGNFRLSSNSPCINAGRNLDAPAEADLDGQDRIAGGTVDIGAFEFPVPTSLLSYAWAQQYGLATDGSADFTDMDDDDMKNYGEWRSDTNPTNSLSVLRVLTVTNSPTGASVTWQSVSTRSYWLERTEGFDLATPFQVVATNINGAAGTKTILDTGAKNAGPVFYRVGVY